MNLTNFVITFVMVVAVLTGFLLFSGDVFQQTNTTDATSGQFQNINVSASQYVTVANKTYDASKQLSPVSFGGDILGIIVNGLVSAANIVGASLGSVSAIITDLTRILMLPDFVSPLIIAILMVVMAFTIFKIFRGGLTNL